MVTCRAHAPKFAGSNPAPGIMNLLLYVSCSLVILSSILVVVSRNALHSVLFLLACFFFSSLSIFLLENEFLAFFFLIIYLGAIIVLFLFVVMMLDLKHNLLKLSKTHLPVGVLIGFPLYSYIVFIHNWRLRGDKYVENGQKGKMHLGTKDLLDQNVDVLSLGEILYNNYAAQLLLAGLLLYVSAIGVVFVTSNRHPSYMSKNLQMLTRQLSRGKVL